MEISSVYVKWPPLYSRPSWLTDWSITGTRGTSLIYHLIRPNSHPDVLWPLHTQTPTHTHQKIGSVVLHYFFQAVPKTKVLIILPMYTEPAEAGTHDFTCIRNGIPPTIALCVRMHTLDSHAYKLFLISRSLGVFLFCVSLIITKENPFEWSFYYPFKTSGMLQICAKLCWYSTRVEKV